MDISSVIQGAIVSFLRGEPEHAAAAGPSGATRSHPVPGEIPQDAALRIDRLLDFVYRDCQAVLDRAIALFEGIASIQRSPVTDMISPGVRRQPAPPKYTREMVRGPSGAGV